jgi:hypothetical protein
VGKWLWTEAWTEANFCSVRIRRNGSIARSRPPEFRGKDRTEPVPPVAHRFVADLDPALMQQFFDVAQR